MINPSCHNPFRFTGSMTAVLQVAQSYLCGPKNEDAFGYAELNNLYNTSGGGVFDATLGRALGGDLEGI